MKEFEKSDAVKFLDRLIKSYKLRNNKFKSLGDLYIRVLGNRPVIQMCGLAKWCTLLNMPYNREDWNGNEQCNTDWDMIWFVYKGVQFFELVEKLYQPKKE